VCAHSELEAIDRALLAGEPKSVISRRWYLPADATERHFKNGHTVRREHVIHGKEMFVPTGEGDNVLLKLQELAKVVWGLMARCAGNNQYLQSLACARELTRVYELVAKLTGQLDESARVNIAVVQRQQRDTEQSLMLERLTIEERVQLRRLVAKAQGEPEAIPVTASAVSVTVNGSGDVDGTAESVP
jgi:hypothetical protein